MDLVSISIINHVISSEHSPNLELPFLRSRYFRKMTDNGNIALFFALGAKSRHEVSRISRCLYEVASLSKLRISYSSEVEGSLLASLFFRNPHDLLLVPHLRVCHPQLFAFCIYVGRWTRPSLASSNTRTGVKSNIRTYVLWDEEAHGEPLFTRELRGASLACVLILL